MAGARRQHLGAQAPCALCHGVQLSVARRGQAGSFDRLIEILPNAGVRPPGVALAHGLPMILGYVRPIASTGSFPGMSRRMSPRKEPEHGVEKGSVGQRVRLSRFCRQVVTYGVPLVVLELRGRRPLGRWITLFPAFGKNDGVGIDAQRQKRGPARVT